MSSYDYRTSPPVMDSCANFLGQPLLGENFIKYLTSKV